MTQPTYVTFEQAKKLTQLGLSVKSDKYWVMMTKDEYTEMSDVQLEDLDYSVGIGGNLVITKYQQWQVVEWLLDKYGIYVSVDMLYDEGETGFWYCIRQKKDDDHAMCSMEYLSPREAYEAAIDYVLNNLI
jgi:hypothetical protein